MNKSTVIATCLVNSSMIRTLEEAEATVRSIFIEERPMADFSKWNCDVNDKTAENIISSIGRAGRINVAKFISDIDD